MLPYHTAVFRGDVGNMKGAAACVESVFSGVRRLLGDFAATMSPEIPGLYLFIHYNWQYDWMQPTTEEIVEAYVKTYGHEPLPDDLLADEDEAPDGEDGEAGEVDEDEVATEA